MLLLTVKKVDAFKFDGFGESDNTEGKWTSSLLPKKQANNREYFSTANM